MSKSSSKILISKLFAQKKCANSLEMSKDIMSSLISKLFAQIFQKMTKP